MGLFNSYLGGWSGVLSGIGSGLNKVTGATQASAQQQKYNLINGAVNQAYAMQSAAKNNEYQKEFAQNAHQWEIEDLKKAGLNPVLSAGGSGASASGGGVSSGAVSGAGLAQSGINPLDVILNGVSTMTTAKRTKAETKNLDMDSKMKAANTLLLAKNAAQSESTKRKIDQEARLLSAQATQQELETEWNQQHPTAYTLGKYIDIFGDATGKLMDTAGKIYIGSKFKGATGLLKNIAKGKKGK